MRFVLAGQPNSGKSTIFNAVAGYRSATANFPGSSVAYTLSRALIHGREVEIVDLPGIYSLTSSDGAEVVALEYLLESEYDLVVNVVDASRLGRSLELTLQLLELRRPLVVALNMTDEAEVKGIAIDPAVLSARLGVPVVATVGRRGQGLKALFRVALQQAHAATVAAPLELDREVESAIAAVSAFLPPVVAGITAPTRFLATKLVERDAHVTEVVVATTPDLQAGVDRAVEELETAHGWSSDQVVSGARHAVAHAIEAAASTHARGRIGWRERVDRVLLHPFSGGPAMILILASFFMLVFKLGQAVEGPVIALFDAIAAAIAVHLPTGSLLGTLVNGLVMGVSAGFSVVLPYLVPFLIGLAILEDTGYLPRMAYILDNLMHRIGLHGKSILPLILGYGCSVPAIMATRILETPRDRRLTATLTAFIPCSARTVVIYGLVAAYLGPLWALGIYLLNIVVIVAIGNILARTMKGRSPGLILEIPDLRLPQAKTMLAKTWLSLKEFITIAWPLLIASSIVLGGLEYLGAADALNRALAPLTVTVLGLPELVGVTLIFGVLRKELTLVMLVQALGTTDIDTAMSTLQMVVFTLFVVFYLPCVATVGAMVKELGWKDTTWISLLTVVVAVVVAVAGRVVLAPFLG